MTTPPVCTTAATSASASGSFKRSCAGAVSPNYNFSYVDGNVAVGKAALSIKADDATFKTYLERIPVVALDGEELYAFFVDESDLRARLA